MAKKETTKKTAAAPNSAEKKEVKIEAVKAPEIDEKIEKVEKESEEVIKDAEEIGNISAEVEKSKAALEKAVEKAGDGKATEEDMKDLDKAIGEEIEKMESLKDEVDKIVTRNNRTKIWNGIDYGLL